MSSTYADRMKEIVDEEQKSAFKKKKTAVKFKMSDTERGYAQAMIDLRENPDFKKFMELESQLIGERMGEAFKLPAEELLDTNDYGCKMAFNHGRYYQMKYVANSRLLLQRLYIAEKQNEKEASDGEDQKGE